MLVQLIRRKNDDAQRLRSSLVLAAPRSEDREPPSFHFWGRAKRDLHLG